MWLYAFIGFAVVLFAFAAVWVERRVIRREKRSRKDRLRRLFAERNRRRL